MKVISLSVLWILILTRCSDQKIEITSEYIINPNWDKQANAIEINKLKVHQDSVINPFADLSQGEILNKLEDDTSFLFVGNAKFNGEKYSTRKIYFDRYNGFPWWTKNGNAKTATIGNLQKGNWYKFSHLVTYPYYVYIYIDSLDRVHRFDVNLANY